MRNSTKSIIRRACIQVIENPNAKPREKLQAAAILEKMQRTKDLAALRKRKNSQTNLVTLAKNGRIDDILCQVAAN